MKKLIVCLLVLSYANASLGGQLAFRKGKKMTIANPTQLPKKQSAPNNNLPNAFN